VLLAAVSAALFLSSFAGYWDCSIYTPTDAPGAFPARVTWRIAGATGGPWTIATWNLRKAGGTAYVSYDPSLKVWVFDDYHSDGSEVRSISTGPDTDGVWHWYGTRDQQHPDPSQGEITWVRVNEFIIQQTYTHSVDGQVSADGFASCRK